MVELTGEVEQFLRAQRVARLATVDALGQPHVVPIVFAYAAGRLYTPIDLKPKLVSPRRLQRVRNIMANPHVQVLLDHYEDDWRQLGYVQLRGRAELIDRGHEYRRAVRLLERSYPQYARLPLQGRPVIKVSVEYVFAWGQLLITAASKPPASRRVTVEEVKRASSGERVSLRAQVLRAWVEGGVPMSLCFSQPCNVASEMPRSAARCVIGFSRNRANSTARWRNSAGYRVAILDSSL